MPMDAAMAGEKGVRFRGTSLSSPVPLDESETIQRDGADRPLVWQGTAAPGCVRASYCCGLLCVRNEHMEAHTLHLFHTQYNK
ncbi:hypothetical protein E2C01_057987 [Portunus trituberculatus]|uniref:Uncharacterized protein n=1 Tax=Portunus trituberculatus TaxID=210409 RepID=A0A5B7H1U2_PORTR|nr:hypothetical protein [Portunus trituberculatus]